ncbi:unnamed protein product [Prorocentrum cordatum]|uniref:Uncharacterized protein n=1 Tax=Prorocentrum cordatum TaxID=2364126 RepID=A0ABN9TQD4_9DINO|nr:unnamed protein product [Polarella glacialis]
MTAHNVRVARKGAPGRSVRIRRPVQMGCELGLQEALSQLDRLSASDATCLRRLLATEAREVGDGEPLRYGSLTSCPDTGLCDLLVRRLADILRAAGPGRLVGAARRGGLAEEERVLAGGLRAAAEQQGVAASELRGVRQALRGRAGGLCPGWVIDAAATEAFGASWPAAPPCVWAPPRRRGPRARAVACPSGRPRCGQRVAPCRFVVLSSTWRCPQYAKRVLKLEGAISAHLGSPFQFRGAREFEGTAIQHVVDVSSGDLIVHAKDAGPRNSEGTAMQRVTDVASASDLAVHAVPAPCCPGQPEGWQFSIAETHRNKRRELERPHSSHETHLGQSATLCQQADVIQALGTGKWQCVLCEEHFVTLGKAVNRACRRAGAAASAAAAPRGKRARAAPSRGRRPDPSRASDSRHIPPMPDLSALRASQTKLFGEASAGSAALRLARATSLANAALVEPPVSAEPRVGDFFEWPGEENVRACIMSFVKFGTARVLPLFRRPSNLKQFRARDAGLPFATWVQMRLGPMAPRLAFAVCASHGAIGDLDFSASDARQLRPIGPGGRDEKERRATRGPRPVGANVGDVAGDFRAIVGGLGAAFSGAARRDEAAFKRSQRRVESGGVIVDTGARSALGFELGRGALRVHKRFLEALNATSVDAARATRCSRKWLGSLSPEVRLGRSSAGPIFGGADDRLAARAGVQGAALLDVPQVLQLRFQGAASLAASFEALRGSVADERCYPVHGEALSLPAKAAILEDAALVVDEGAPDSRFGRFQARLVTPRSGIRARWPSPGTSAAWATCSRFPTSPRPAARRPRSGAGPSSAACGARALGPAACLDEESAPGKGEGDDSSAAGDAAGDGEISKGSDDEHRESRERCAAGSSCDRVLVNQLHPAVLHGLCAGCRRNLWAAEAGREVSLGAVAASRWEQMPTERAQLGGELY